MKKEDCFLCSQSLEDQVLVEAEEAVVPEEYTVCPRYRSCSQNRQLHHVVKVAVVEREENEPELAE